MSEFERQRLAAALAQAKSYLEFGMGGSTLMAVRAGVGRIVAVESDPAWVAAVAAHAEIAPRLADSTVRLLHADIGPVAEWGRPADRSALRKWSNYITVAWTEWARLGLVPDLVLVDGRFRIACCLSCALVAGQRTDPITVLMHDVDDARPHYREVLGFFDEIESVETLLVMRPKRDVPVARVLAALMERQFDFT
jgi:hypothetical protein